MKSTNRVSPGRQVKLALGLSGGTCGAISALLVGCLVAGLSAHSQTLPSGWQEGFTLSAGGTASGYYLGYGGREIAGPAVFVDAETRHRFGIEGEARWLRIPQTSSVHNTTWLIGGRSTVYAFERKWYPYAKGLIGFTQFNFPYNYAKGDYLVIAPGGGLDMRISERVRMRVVDAEYQFWPQFSFTNVSSWGISTGVRVRVF